MLFQWFLGTILNNCLMLNYIHFHCINLCDPYCTQWHFGRYYIYIYIILFCFKGLDNHMFLRFWVILAIFLKRTKRIYIYIFFAGQSAAECIYICMAVFHLFSYAQIRSGHPVCTFLMTNTDWGHYSDFPYDK